MAFMVNLKEVYIDLADVEAYLTEIANLWQGEEDNYENEAVTSQIMDFVYNKDTDDAHFTFEKADNELVMRKGKDFYQLIRQIRTKVDSEVPADVTPLVAQTINQNVQQNLRMRMQMQSGPFAQTTSRGYIARQQSEGNN
ncbi:hypothetical protein [Weissella confusa]|uniref:hypothetical protein n=1 Tax=Weissella confusa TaxID=1583 RepID=UPI0018F21DD7|nr:hypothetical protein [Weissella confusa]MBJ7690234.1 hypothetical protein [Weissella confusa]MBJ7700528.1 hypothetical protein [Weissella confusa]